jgi:hypothetical protein
MPAGLPPGDRNARGALPDSRSVPRVPHQPALGDDVQPSAAATAAAHENVWILPVTTSMPRCVPTRQPPFLVQSSVSPNLVLNPFLVRPLLAQELARATVAPLVLVLRSGDLGYRRLRAQFAANVARLLAHPGLAHCEFTSPPVAIRRWRERRDQ